MSNLAVRTFKQSDRESFLNTQIESFRGLEYPPRIKVGLPALDQNGTFVAERNGSMVGCIGLFTLDRPGWFEIRNLAVRDSTDTETIRILIKKVVDYVTSNHAEYVKASTPAVQPYVDVYKESGFQPVRRSVRICWELAACEAQESKITTGELSEDRGGEAGDVWLEGLRPYWDYWIDENGGPEPIKAWVKESVAKRQGWIGAFVEKKLVGVAILRPDAYGPGTARFNGAYTIPQMRKKGIGSALMNATIGEAKRRNQKTMRVYTLAFLDHLAPGAVLYLKSGGRIEAEYLQLQLKTGS